MDTNELLATYAAPVVSSAFMFAFGACVGSLTNVLVYRLPRGLDVVAPPSRCPACDTLLTWRENIPVLGWLALRGRCRFCKSRISPEYPLVEAFVGLLCVLLFLLWYILRPGSEWLGVDWGTIKPEWAESGWAQTWPSFIVLLVLASSLVAMTLVDAKTFTIPLVLTTVPAIVGLIAHPAHALWVQLSTPGALRHHADHEVWTLATFGSRGWSGLGAGIGGMLGLVVSMLLLRFKVLTRSFADYDEWERKALGEPAEAETNAAPPIPPQEAAGSDPAVDPPAIDITAASSPPASPEVQPAPAPPAIATDLPVGPQHEPSAEVRRTVLIYTACTLGLAACGAILAPAVGAIPFVGVVIGALLGPIIAGLITSASSEPAKLLEGEAAFCDADPPANPSATDPADGDHVGDPTMWLAYPHARREMVRELAFLCAPILLAIAGAALFRMLGGPWSPDPSTGDLIPARELPLWAVALGGSLMGYLIGGAVVWGVRIFGSLAFGKEAMGLGDVHLMAAVGACVGWIDATLAFFLAAFVGLYWVIASAARTRGKVERAMPYGPYLAAATMLVILGKPAVELALSRLLNGTPVDLP